MLDELAKDPFQNTNYQARTALARKLNYLRPVIGQGDRVLDVGARNPLTAALEAEHNIQIDCTEGDLDVEFTIPRDNYDVIIYSHTIEHQFNPLFTLLKLREVLAAEGTLYVFLPQRGKLLWTPGHFHEIDDYRMRLLFKRANFRVLHRTREKAWRHWTSYVKGIRPLYRLFREFDAIYAVKKAPAGESTPVEAGT